MKIEGFTALRVAGAWGLLVFGTAVAPPPTLAAAPQVASEPQQVVVTGQDYRVTFHRWLSDWQFALRDSRGQWRTVTRQRTRPEFAVVDAHGVHSSVGSPVQLAEGRAGDAVVVGWTTILPSSPPTIARLDLLCTDVGILLRSAGPGPPAAPPAAGWVLPRLTLDETLFDAFAYWRAPDELRSGRFADLGPPAVYVGVSPWGNQGDTAARLSVPHPAVIARGEAAGLALGVVLLDYADGWAGSHTFLQRHTPSSLYLYAAIADRPAPDSGRWAWLAPFPMEADAARAKVEQLRQLGNRLRGGFRSRAPEPEAHWTQAVPDFPADLRRPQPVADLGDAVVYTINETILADDGIGLARKTGSDVLIRGWFKWGTAPAFDKLAPLVPQAHALGALFGGGITCSALYHGENGLSEDRVRDMATRGPDGQLVDAWGEPHCRHGTLSNPAYRQYLLSWCQRQLDAGADYLFMDEINAALAANEGFDDYALADFRKFLLERYGPQGWTTADRRWRETFRIDLADRRIAPDATMNTFQYRAYLQALGLTARPHAPDNPLAAAWHAFREARDDRAWKWLTDAIRAHAAARGRRVLISANGLARYVDLQVLGVWDKWQTAEGRIDLAESQLDQWASTVAAGWGLAGRRVPVVFFHDWGFGGFPWMEVSPADRQLWIRVRGAEIYAAGGFFAFPVHGPFGNDARLDGTLPEIARQSAFYQRHRDLYRDTELVGFEPLEADGPALSVALWRSMSPPRLILHVINRQAEGAQPLRRGMVTIGLPVDRAPKTVRVVSPDWDGEKAGQTRLGDGRLAVILPELAVYDVASLEYDTLPAVSLTGRRLVPSWQWARPARNEFVVRPGGLVDDAWALPGMLQGQLHQHLRNPPTFLVNMPQGGTLCVHIRGVATLGARLQWTLDGQLVTTIDLPDRDGQNDGQAREYDQTFELPIPPGRHRAQLDNRGGDWACIGWYAFRGEAALFRAD